MLGKIYTCSNVHNCKLLKSKLPEPVDFNQILRVGYRSVMSRLPPSTLSPSWHGQGRLANKKKTNFPNLSAVQHRRDAIGHYSEQYAAIKQRNQDSIRSETSLDSSSRSSSSCPSTIVGENILEEILASYEDYQKRRKSK